MSKPFPFLKVHKKGEIACTWLVTEKILALDGRQNGCFIYMQGVGVEVQESSEDLIKQLGFEVPTIFSEIPEQMPGDNGVLVTEKLQGLPIGDGMSG